MRYIYIAVLLLVMSAMSACSHRSDVADFNTLLADAGEALADNNVELAQHIANNLRDIALGADSSAVTPSQTVMLSILYMRLSEQAAEEENIAEATQLFRRALRESPDSVRVCYELLSVDDTRHFELLRRLGTSIDNPVELDDSVIVEHDMLPEGEVQN